MKVYLDNAATTKVHPRVIEKMLPYLDYYYGNPSSIHSFGRNARVAVEESREIIADFINADPSEIYFTSCGTESSNFIITGIAKTEFIESGKNHLVTSAGDHKATLKAIERLSENGFQSDILKLNKKFKFENNILNDFVSKKTSLISLIHVNNETGTTFDAKQIRQNINNVYFHIDAVQSFGKINLDVKDLGIDALSVSAHKLYGPKGIGAAFIKSGTPMNSLILGGGQERNRRAGTENVASIVGFAEAVKIAKESMAENFENVQQLKNYFWSGLIGNGIAGILNNSKINSSPYILSVTLDPEIYQTDSEATLMFLDINGIAVSAGSACTSGTLKPSHVILAGGYSEAYAKGTIRFSFSTDNTIEELDYTIEVMKKLAQKIRR
jgi:cysteine desulfurase